MLWSTVQVIVATIEEGAASANVTMMPRVLLSTDDEIEVANAPCMLHTILSSAMPTLASNSNASEKFKLTCFTPGGTGTVLVARVLSLPLIASIACPASLPSTIVSTAATKDPSVWSKTFFEGGASIL